MAYHLPLRGAVTSQPAEVLASRTQTSVQRAGVSYAQTPNPTQQIIEIVHGLRNGIPAIAIGVEANETHEHAMLAIGLSGDKIVLYDSNHPAEWSLLTYTFVRDAAGSPVGFVKYLGWNWVTTIPPVIPFESFAIILMDAELSFHQENQTQIEITSHAYGDTVDQPSIQLVGKIHSGEVGIEEVTVEVSSASGTHPYPSILLKPGQEDFSIPLEMIEGDNTIRFVSKGTLFGQGPTTIPHAFADSSHPNEFVLRYKGKPAPGTLKVTATGQYEFTASADAWLELSYKDDGTPEDEAGYTRYNVRGLLVIDTQKPIRIHSSSGSYFDCMPADTAIDLYADGSSDKRTKIEVNKSPPGQIWSLRGAWTGVTCTDNSQPLGSGFSLMLFWTSYCGTPSFVPIDDPATIKGSYTLASDCNATGSSVTVEWSFPRP